MTVTDKPWPREEPEDVLTRSGFHKALLLFNRPSTWSLVKMAVVVLLPLAAVALVWPAAAAVLALFVLGDLLLLLQLPRRGLSYGPWQSQLLALLIPRVLAALFAAALRSLAGAGAGWIVLVGSQLAGSGALVWGALVEPFRVRLTELRFESRRLPPGSEPIRLLHITDLHVERLTKREERLLELVSGTPADLIVITGDYLNLSYTIDAQTHRDVRHLLSQLQAPCGAYAVLGSPPVDRRDVTPGLFEGLPVQLLVDREQVVDLGDGRRLLLLGMDCTHHLPTDGQRLRALAAGAPDDLPQVLLYHAPDLMPQAAELGLDLYLCGHTHGGQVRLPLYGALITSSQLGKRFEMGHYRLGDTHLYVSRGLGLEGLGAPRVRFLAPPEITLVTIAPAAS
jgi:uncharacterized protein